MKKISNNEVVLKCHDDKAMTYDIIQIDSMNQDKNFFECSESDYCDYETYTDTDIADLSKKIDNNWESVKKIINKVLKDKDLYEVAFKQKGFCVIVEPIFKEVIK